MKNSIVKTKNLALAEVRYFDEERQAVEVMADPAYVILMHVKDSYINPFHLGEELPVYTRLPYSNTTLDGEDFGTKIALASGDVKDGPCFVINEDNLEPFFGIKEISIEELGNYMIQSSKFFVDRMNLLEDGYGSVRRNHSLKKKMKRDMERLEALNEAFSKQG